jgi:predicted acylesterase/phospholipase RssA
MTTYDLVFEGGGAKGVAFAGAIRALEEVDFRAGRLLGTSAGAVTATLIAVGYSADTILQLLTERLPNGESRFSTFADVPAGFQDAEIAASHIVAYFKRNNIPLIPEALEARGDQAIMRVLLALPLYRQLFSFVELGGLYVGDAFLQWMVERLDAMDTLGAATLANLHEHTGHELTLTAADVSDRRLLILNHRTAPNLPVAWAVRMSMSVPFYWQEVTWRKEWGGYRALNLTGHKLVDGGVLSGFPMELLLSQDAYVTDVMGQPEGTVLGFLLDEDGVVSAENPPRMDIAHNPVGTAAKTLQRALALVNTMMSAHDKMVLEAYKELVVRLPTKGYGAFEFDMAGERLAQLVRAAYRATQQTLTNLDSRPKLLPKRTTSAIDAIACQLLERNDSTRYIA